MLFWMYALFWVIFWNFLFGFYVSKIKWEVVPSAWDFIHMKLAIFFICIVFVITFLLRKYLYLEVFSEAFFEKGYKQNKKYIKDDKEIYVNKEIK